MFRKELDELRVELTDVESRIKKLIKRRRVLKQELKAKAEKPFSTEVMQEITDSFSKTFKLYVLELENGHWLVGCSKNIDESFKRHKSGKGAYYSKMHKPIRIVERRDTNTVYSSEASQLENALTLEYAKKYGTKNVRGGGYSQSKPKWPLLES